MNDQVEFKTLKALYESVQDEKSISYEAFRQKLHRLAESNPRTYNAVSRRLGIEPPRRRSKKHPLSTYVAPPFVAYDGEGWGDKYILLANSLGERISNLEGLSSKECLEFLSKRHDHVTRRVFFSFGYDVNHIIKDFSNEQIATLVSGLTVTYEGYRVGYIPGKIFTVNNIRYYDVFSFFATSFINVVDLMLGHERITESLVTGKAARGNFETWSLDKIIAYNDEELKLLVEVLNKLRSAFEEIGVYLTAWYGPGAVARYWFKEHQISPKEKNTFSTFKALNSAYYGGRFEQISLGKFSRIYEYDIHSAYPAVMADMPYFLSWKPVKAFVDHPYSLWYISFDLREDYKVHDWKHHNFFPLPIRDATGRICFPMVGKGWYWYPEVRVLLDYFPNAKIIWHKGYLAETEGKPFEWIKELYNYRQKLKGEGNLAQLAIKVGLNSLYGKTAQKVGKNPYFSLAWAGYITSATRAKIARAGYESGYNHTIGFATDALFSKTKLNVPISDNLGDWEEERYNQAIFFQSGIYRLIKDGKVSDRYRGSPLRGGIDDIITQLKLHKYNHPSVKIGRFISNMLAIKAPETYGKYRLQFVKVEHTLNLDAPYKRHYGFSGTMNKYGMKSHINYSRLLYDEIGSSPKVYVNDNHDFISDEYLNGDLAIHGMESYPPALKDTATMRILEECNGIALDATYDEVSKLETLNVVEDESM